MRDTTAELILCKAVARPMKAVETSRVDIITHARAHVRDVEGAIDPAVELIAAAAR